MLRRFARLIALIPLVLAQAAVADEAVQAQEPPAVPSAPAEVSEPALPNDRLPTAERPGFFKRHPLTLPKLSMPDPEFAKYKPLGGYAGVGFFNDMIAVNGMAPTEKGQFYLRVGRFFNSNEGIAVNGGWRYPLKGAVTENGYMAGVFAGHIIGESLGGKVFNRLGAGADLAYQWVNPHTVKVLAIGIGVGEEDRLNGYKQRAKPEAFFSYTVNLKVF